MVNALLVFGIGAVALASSPPHLATRDEVLAQAKHDSSQWCSEPSSPCECSISPTDEGWSVFVVTVSVAADGRRSYPVGGHQAFIYSLEGKLLREVSGL
jgi:hypothetical protein